MNTDTHIRFSVQVEKASDMIHVTIHDRGLIHGQWEGDPDLWTAHDLLAQHGWHIIGGLDDDGKGTAVRRNHNTP